MDNRHCPRRTCLSVPGSNARTIEKAKRLAADRVFLDLEDAVAPDAKAQARTQVAHSLGDGGGAGPSTDSVGDDSRVARRTHRVEAQIENAQALTNVDGYRRALPRGARGAVLLADEMIDAASRKIALVIAGKGRAAGMTRIGEAFAPPS